MATALKLYNDAWRLLPTDKGSKTPRGGGDLLDPQTTTCGGWSVGDQGWRKTCRVATWNARELGAVLDVLLAGAEIWNVERESEVDKVRGGWTM